MRDLYPSLCSYPGHQRGQEYGHLPGRWPYLLRLTFTTGPHNAGLTESRYFLNFLRLSPANPSKPEPNNSIVAGSGMAEKSELASALRIRSLAWTT